MKWIQNIFKKRPCFRVKPELKAKEKQMDKFLIVGLGNPGDEYDKTRHNTGFMVADAFASQASVTFQDKRYGFVAETSVKGRKSQQHS